MDTIYVDGSVAALESDLDDRLAHLVESGRELVLVGPPDHTAAARAAWSGHVPALPDAPTATGWYLTADPATCRDRQPGLRTILIGPRDDGQHPTRCDATARDLRDAVLADPHRRRDGLSHDRGTGRASGACNLDGPPVDAPVTDRPEDWGGGLSTTGGPGARVSIVSRPVPRRPARRHAPRVDRAARPRGCYAVAMSDPSRGRRAGRTGVYDQRAIDVDVDREPTTTE